MAETYFDIVVRAKNIVSQGFNDAIAQSKAAASAFNSMSLGGAGGSFGKLGLSIEGVKGALRLAGAAAQALKGDFTAVDQSLSKLPMGIGEVYQAARDLVGVLFETDKAAARAANIERWEKLGDTIAEVRRKTEGANLADVMVNDFARQRLAANDLARNETGEAQRKFDKTIAETSWQTDEGRIRSGEEALRAQDELRRAKIAIEEQRLRAVARIDDAEVKAAADDFNRRNENARRIEERQRQAARQAAEEQERYASDIARQRAEIAEGELRAAGKLLEADRARNAEAARSALERARSEEERQLIIARQRLADRGAEEDENKRRADEKRKGDRGGVGFDLVEITSRVSGLAALQKSGWEAGLDKHAARVEGGLREVRFVCGQIVQAVQQKRMDGLALGF